MRDVLLNFWAQIVDSRKASLSLMLPDIKSPTNIIVCGMGGSAISGDLLQGYLQAELPIPLLVNRDYELPNFVNQDSLVFILTYSGNTEETLSVYHKATGVTNNVICITSGGQLESLVPAYIVKVPKGYQPRCALGWLFVPIIVVLQRTRIIGDKGSELAESVSLLRDSGKKFAKLDSPPMKLANQLLGRLPIIYSDSRFSGVAKRWVTQLNENAKVFAHFNEFSELNHNEIVGFGNPMLNSLVVILKDKGYNPRIQHRIEITKHMITPYTEVHEIESEGNSLLARFFWLIYFGDWVSYWLAVLRGVDPTPVERIERLKRELSKKLIS